MFRRPGFPQIDQANQWMLPLVSRYSRLNNNWEGLFINYSINNKFGRWIILSVIPLMFSKSDERSLQPNESTLFVRVHE